MSDLACLSRSDHFSLVILSNTLFLDLTKLDTGSCSDKSMGRWSEIVLSVRILCAGAVMPDRGELFSSEIGTGDGVSIEMSIPSDVWDSAFMADPCSSNIRLGGMKLPGLTRMKSKQLFPQVGSFGSLSIDRELSSIQSKNTLVLLAMLKSPVIITVVSWWF